jgi:phosphate:Na+ symporter
MTYTAFASAAGGLALFLLAMGMMTDGLKVAAGGALRQLLERWTSSTLRGVATGILVTGVVQSSSAVTVATIGFVNAGVLTLRQALGVVYGTNVGTTMTGWLVSLVGFGLKIEAFALPILAVGVALRVGVQTPRWRGLGEALAGFGLFFLGLSLLKEAFAGVAAQDATTTHGGPLAYFGVGVLATVLTQSSSAALALVLSAAASGIVATDAAAAAVIGANLGTTSTALLAVLRATPNARRLALAHVLFNVATAVVAFALLPLLLGLTTMLTVVLKAEGSPAAALALFHTAFNVLGVLLMLPLTPRLSAFLQRRFRSREDDLARPQHLDATLTATAALATAAAREELARMRRLVASLAKAALSATPPQPGELERRAIAIRSLGAAIAEFVGNARPEPMTREAADELARALRIALGLDEAAHLAPEVSALRADPNWRAAVGDAETVLCEAAVRCARLAERAGKNEQHDTERVAALEQFEGAYEQAKEALLAATVARRVGIDTAGVLLDRLSRTRRMVEQLVKADRLLREPVGAAGIEREASTTVAANA